MRQARLRFYERIVCPIDQFLAGWLPTMLGLMTLVGFVWNIAGGVQT